MHKNISLLSYLLKEKRLQRSSKRKALALTLSLAILFSLTFLTTNIEPAQAITIGSNGGISGTDKMQYDGNVYTLTDNVDNTIRIDKSNIVLDGAGFTLERKSIIGDTAGIVILPGVDEVTIKNLKIKDFVSGITLKGSGNAVFGCSITDCSTGIGLNEATGNTISDNKFFNNKAGIQLHNSLNNQFRNNKLENGSISTGLDGNFNDIDPSNTIDGKPIYYLVNQKNLVISPSDYPEIGYLALVNCTGITVTDLKISGYPANGNGIILRYTTNSMITHNSLTNLWSGIYIYDSYNNTITENYIGNNRQSISISATVANSITRNNIENNEVGIYLDGSAQIIYHNNFLNNINHVDSPNWHPLIRGMVAPFGMHIWDNGYPSGGNFWSDFNPTDNDNDGIGDTANVINQNRNNTDHYPLMRQVDISAPMIIPTPIDEYSSEPFPTLAVVVASVVVSVFVAAAGLLVYFKKRKP